MSFPKSFPKHLPFRRFVISPSNSRYGSFCLLDRNTALYSGHVSSLAGDSRVPAKNRKPRAIARIADALFFREKSIHIAASVILKLTFSLSKKRGERERERRSRSHDDHLIDLADREWRYLLKINFGVD